MAAIIEVGWKVYGISGTIVDGFEGTVEKISPATPTHHGTVEIRVINPGKAVWVKPGEIEHFSHVGIEKLLRL